MGRAAQRVLAGRQRPPGAQPPLDLTVVGVDVEVKGVDVAVLVVAHDHFAAKRHLAVAAVAGEVAVIPSSSLMPRLRGDVVDPGGVGLREDQHIERMAILLVGVANRVRQVAVLLDVPFDCVGRDALRLVAVGPVDHAAASGVGAQPENAVVHLGDRVGRRAAHLVKGALDALERKVGGAGVVPDFGRVGPKQPDLAVADQDREQAIGRTFSAGEVERVDLRAFQQARHPDLLAVWFVEHEVAVEVADRDRAGEIRVRNLREGVRAGVVDVAGAVGRDEQLRAIVGHRHRPGSSNGAQHRRGPGRRDLV